MLTVVSILVCSLVGIRFGYWLKEEEIKDALVPSVEEQDINVHEADMDKGSNND